LVTSKNFEIP